MLQAVFLFVRVTVELQLLKRENVRSLIQLKLLLQILCQFVVLRINGKTLHAHGLDASFKALITISVDHDLGQEGGRIWLRQVPLFPPPSL